MLSSGFIAFGSVDVWVVAAGVFWWASLLSMLFLHSFLKFPWGFGVRSRLVSNFSEQFFLGHEPQKLFGLGLELQDRFDGEAVCASPELNPPFRRASIG